MMLLKHAIFLCSLYTSYDVTILRQPAKRCTFVNVSVSTAFQLLLHFQPLIWECPPSLIGPSHQRVVGPQISPSVYILINN